MINKPADATHYMEANGEWVGTWFKKDENGKWVGMTDSMKAWDDNCGYDEELIKPIPVNSMHKAAPKMYAMLESMSELMKALDNQTHPSIELDAVEYDIDKLLAEARGEL